MDATHDGALTQLPLWPDADPLDHRLAAFGWRLTRDGAGWRSWRLDYDGPPAWFGSREGCSAWLAHQEKRRKQ